MGLARFFKKLFLRRNPLYPALLLTTLQAEVPSAIRFEAVGEEEFVEVVEERGMQPNISRQVIVWRIPFVCRSFGFTYIYLHLPAACPTVTSVKRADILNEK